MQVKITYTGSVEGRMQRLTYRDKLRGEQAELARFLRHRGDRIIFVDGDTGKSVTLEHMGYSNE